MKRQALAILLALAAAAAVYLAFAWRAREGAPAEPPRVVEIAKDRPEDMPPDHQARREQAQGAGETAVASGETIELDVRTLSPGKPVVLRLMLAEPSRTAEPLPARIIGTDGRTLDLESALAADRFDARVEIDPTFLTPGRYMLEVRTTEQSHFPRRRYVIVVK